MAVYGKKLHIKKNNAVTDINLYTTKAEASSPALCLEDGNSTVYAALGATNHANASALRVKSGNTTYAVLKSAFNGHTKLADPGTGKVYNVFENYSGSSL